MLDAVAVKRAHFGSFEFHPIHLDNVQCTGSEENITQCSYATSTAINCDHSEDAGVICGSKYICSQHCTNNEFFLSHMYMHINYTNINVL